MKTFFETSENAQARRTWKLVDAAGRPLGRLASEVAAVLRGKNNPRYTPHTDTGEGVVIINAEKVVLTGNKAETKKYYKHTGYVGNMKVHTAGELHREKPEQLIEEAVWGMLPKGPLGRKQFSKLRVYKGEAHPHTAQVK